MALFVCIIHLSSISSISSISISSIYHLHHLYHLLYLSSIIITNLHLISSLMGRGNHRCLDAHIFAGAGTLSNQAEYAARRTGVRRQSLAHVKFRLELNMILSVLIGFVWDLSFDLMFESIVDKELIKDWWYMTVMTFQPDTWLQCHSW